MPTNLVFWIILAAVVALALAAFQYLFKDRSTTKFPWLFTLLRFIALFSVFLLLINPQLDRTEYFVEKPSLVLAVDNSESIKHFGAEEQVQRFVEDVYEDSRIRDKFEVQVFSFGEELEATADLNFEERQTNIQSALRSLDRLYKNTTAPTVLITDGNQTYGEDYRFAAAGYSGTIIPVVVGDTARYVDLAISRINVNRYAYRDNRFPVEMFISYSGNEEVNSRVEIRSGSGVVFSEAVDFSDNERSRRVEALLPASTTGVLTYEAVVVPLTNERDTVNNKRKFAVEVIDERTKVLLVTDMLHPDLGTLKKAVESNRQRELEIHQLGNALPELEDYQLIILYQPNPRFRELLEEINADNRNYWMITGPETDFRFLNRAQGLFQKEITNQAEEYFGIVNDNFGAFQFEDIGFRNFPPLRGSFGETEFKVPAEALLYRQVQGISTEDPLLAVVEQNSSRKAFLFGADIWRWRAASYVETGSFQEFDDFAGKLVQFLASRQRRERLTINHESFYYGNDRIVISAQYFDRNYNFDPRGELELRLKSKESEETQLVPFLLRQNRYEVDVSGLGAGDYEFVVTVSGENISESGSFTVIDFNVERQFSSANLSGLQQVAEEKGEQIYFPDRSGELIDRLLADNDFTPVQKSRENSVPLIDWYYLLFIIAAALSGEWFLRKYYGLI